MLWCSTNLLREHYLGDCVDKKTGIKGRCVVAAITNYTNQLLEYGSDTKSKCKSMLQTNTPMVFLYILFSH